VGSLLGTKKITLAIYPLQNIKWITWITTWITQKVPNDVSSAFVARYISIIQASVSTRKNAYWS